MLTEGALEGVQGGNICHGLVSGAENFRINRYGDDLGRAGKITASAVMGGTASELGGGKFANGAITSTYGMMFNELMHTGGDDDFKMYIDDSYAKKQEEIGHDFSMGNKKDLLRCFKDMNELAMEMEPHEKRALNARLRAACGKELSDIDKRLASSVKRIVKRGKIRNDDEYEKVRTYIDSIEGEPGQEALLKDLYRLVGEFEMSVGDNPSLVGDEWR